VRVAFARSTAGARMRRRTLVAECLLPVPVAKTRESGRRSRAQAACSASVSRSSGRRSTVRSAGVGLGAPNPQSRAWQVEVAPAFEATSADHGRSTRDRTDTDRRRICQVSPFANLDAYRVACPSRLSPGSRRLAVSVRVRGQGLGRPPRGSGRLGSGELRGTSPCPPPKAADDPVRTRVRAPPSDASDFR